MKAIRRKGFSLALKVYLVSLVGVKYNLIIRKQKRSKKKNIITTNIVEDRHNMKFGATGRHVSPDENHIFRNDNQTGSVEICDTGFGTHGITPEECEQRIEMTEADIECIKKDIERLEAEIEELKFKTDKKIV